MKTYKIKKSEYTNLEQLLTRIGAVRGKQAFPSHVYISPKTEAIFKKALRAFVKKKYPGLVKIKIDTTVGMYYLNLGPVTIENGLETGYVLVDEAGILTELEEARTVAKFSTESSTSV